MGRLAATAAAAALAALPGATAFSSPTSELPDVVLSESYVAKAEGTSFKGFNVLADPDLREGIKSYSNWPTIPQVYIDGEFIGGCDTTMEMCAPAKFRRNSERRRNFLRANL